MAFDDDANRDDGRCPRCVGHVVSIHNIGMRCVNCGYHEVLHVDGEAARASASDWVTLTMDDLCAVSGMTRKQIRRALSKLARGQRIEQVALHGAERRAMIRVRMIE